MAFGLFVAASAMLLPFAAAAQTDKPPVISEQELAAPPDATVEFDAKQVSLIVGGASGKGVLHYKGKSYPFTAKAATVGSAGVTEVHGTGTVHYLKSPAQFAGNYSGVGVGAALGKGVGTNTFQNKNGVVLHVKSKGEGAALSLGATALNIKMTKK